MAILTFQTPARIITPSSNTMSQLDVRCRAELQMLETCRLKYR